jgi:CBS-domain-containing membrane protein
MIDINDEDLEDVLASVRQSIAMRVVNKLRIASVGSGRSEMTAEDIDEEISKVRKEKRKC